MVQVGDTAPDFTLNDQDGAPVSLSSYRGNKNVVIFFYPKDHTRVCTAESCLFRDNYEAIIGVNAEVFGVSGDGQESHQSFKNNNNLPFPLLSDPGRKVAKAYAATTALGMLTARVTLVVDKSGKVRQRTQDMFNADVHVQDALRALKQLD